MSPSQQLTVVKVCGITRAQDAQHALACGADWLGFVVRGDSPRTISPEAAGAIVASLDSAERPVVAVAVMVRPTPEEALAIANRMSATRIQLHGVDAPAWPADFPLPCTFVLSVDPTGAVRGTEPAGTELVLLDTAHALLHGGTGTPFPWAAAREMCGRRKVMLAGGLEGGNVTAALESARPWGVDASSRLESSPGVKDDERVRRFVAAVRDWDEQRNATA